MKNKSINFFIASKTIPLLVLILSVSCGLLLFMTKKIVDDQLQSDHEKIIDQFNKNFETTLGSLEQQIVNAANNELIINSLIDPQEREHYIPLFIRSFALAGIDKAYIAITDFSGEVVTHNGKLPETEIFQHLMWEDDVLEDGKNYRYFDENGLFVAAPISFSNAPEGAVIAKIPFSEMHQNISLKDVVNPLIIINDSNNIIYSSDQDNFPLRSKYNHKIYSDWFLSESILTGNYKVISAEPKSITQKKFYFLLVFMMVAIGVAVLCTAVSITLSSRVISDTLNRFIKALEKPDSINLVNDNDPDELVNIGKQFRSLADDLSEARMLKSSVQSIFNSLNECLVVFDTSGNATLTNRAFERLSNKIDVGVQDNFSEIIPPEYKDNFIDAKKQIDDFESVYTLVLPDNTTNSKNCIIHWSRSLYYSEYGELEGVIFVGVDVTAARRIEQELHIKNRAIEEASNGIVISDALEKDMPLVYVNQAFAEMTGYSTDEVIGKNCRLLQGKETDSNSIKNIRDAIKNKEQISETLLNYRKDGTEFFNQLMLTPIRDHQDKVTHYLGIQLDVTDNVKAEQYLLDAKLKAEESAQLKSEFLASMSHEIRTPMNGVLGMLGLLGNSNLTHQQARYTNLAKSSAESLLLLINDILDFSKVEAGKMEFDIIDFHLPEMLGELAESMGQRAQEKGLELVLDVVNVDIAFVKGDPGRIRQVITNLVGNAIKFTDKGNVVIRASLQAHESNRLAFECSVIDTGIGIPDSKLDKLFDSFSQVDASTTRQYGGTGLGLAIVKQLCELMGGSVSVSSHFGQGSEFKVTILLDESEQEADLTPLIDISNHKVLVVDDNKVSGEVLVDQLNQWGVGATHVESAAQGLELINASKSSPFTMAFIDMQISQKGEEELAQAIRADHDFDGMQLVMMTQLNQRVDEKLLSDLGFSSFIPKPVTLHDLLDIFNAESVKNTTEVNTEQSEDEVIPINESKGSFSTHEIVDKVVVEESVSHLLLVEDNLINQEVALGVLEMLGYSVDVANDGCEALEALNNGSYCVVLMDCQMPNMDGYEATRAIRKGEVPDPNIPIIAMTANAMKGDKEKCLAVGMDDYISKPIDPEKLKDCLQTWVDSRRRVHSKVQEQSVESENSQSVIWDEDGFMKRIMNNENIANKLIGLFKTDTPKTIDELESAINENKVEEAGLLAHKLKGSVANLGGIELADLAKSIEQAGKSEKLEEVKELWPQVRPQYNKLLDHIDNRR